MIMGTGFDLASLPRIQEILERNGVRFMQRILTPEEYLAVPEEKQRRTAYIAGRFAAKEAAVKALGTGFSDGIEFKDIEILSLPSGQPELHFHGKAAVRAMELDAHFWHVSISHERDMAGAVVILEK